MRYHVAEATLQKTVKCPNEFACLSGADSCMCKVSRPLGDSFVFVSPERGAACAYCIDFGFTSHVCSCPTRNVLYRKYGV